MADGPLSVALLTYSTRPRGGVVATLALAEALARAGHRVSLWTLARGGDAGFFRPVDPAVEVVAVPFPEIAGEAVGARVLRSITVLREAFEAFPGGYDIVHAQDCITANAVADCMRTVHHLDAFTTPELVACHERALRRPYAHVCVSAAVAAELADGWGITATVIPNGVDAARFSAAAGPEDPARTARERWRARLGRYVLAVGGIEPRKGTADLVEAFALLRERATPVSLVLAGGETLFDYRGYRERVLARAARLGVEPVILGPVAHEELPALVAAADVFAFPSVKEGFGLAALEALAAGVPVVTRDLPVLREVLAAAGDAVRFAATPAGLAAALEAYLDSAEQGGSTEQGHRAEAPARPAGRAAGQAVASGYSWSAAADRHVARYRELIRARSTGRPAGRISATTDKSSVSL
nr:MSMEG_0565 family glycosyltransferase [Parafrankia discariae]